MLLLSLLQRLRNGEEIRKKCVEAREILDAFRSVQALSDKWINPNATDFELTPSKAAEIPDVFKCLGRGLHVCRVINTILKSMSTQQAGYER